MLGHRFLKTIQYYAKILDEMVSYGMKILSEENFNLSKEKNSG